MSAPEFIKLVKQMREAQQHYSKLQTAHYLELKKVLEKKVDAHIQEVEKIQLPLF